MNSLILEAAAKVLEYPGRPLERRHGPRGYADPRLYKPWPRDDFSFRCVYCLCRERWEPNGQDVFSVEHLHSRSTHPERVNDYAYLLYACSICNACRREAPWPFDPRVEAMAMHLRSLPDGTVEALTRQGAELSDLCHLNRPLLVQFRQSLLEWIAWLVKRDGHEEERALRRILGFPTTCRTCDPGGLPVGTTRRASRRVSLNNASERSCRKCIRILPLPVAG